MLVLRTKKEDFHDFDVEEIKRSVIETAQKDSHNEDVSCLQRAVSFNDILIGLPNRFWRKNTGSNFENPFDVDTCKLVMFAIDKLVVEGQIEPVPHLQVNSEKGGKAKIPLGRYEVGYALVGKE